MFWLIYVYLLPQGDRGEAGPPGKGERGETGLPGPKVGLISHWSVCVRGTPVTHLFQPKKKLMNENLVTFKAQTF